MQKRKLMVLFLLISLCLPGFCLAETIVLKSGQIVEGKIIEKTEKYVKVNFEGVDLTYWTDEIESIDNNNLSAGGNGREAFDKGAGYLKEGLLEKALIEFNKAIKFNPENADAYEGRGAVYEYRDLKNAMDDYTKAIEINPNSYKAYTNRARVNFTKGNPDQAMLDYAKAIEINSNYADAYYNRAKLYFSRKEFDKSWLDFNKARQLGYEVELDFLERLKKATGREK